MDDIDLLNLIEELSRALWEKYGERRQEITLTINGDHAVVTDTHGTARELVEL
jgi:hypothetical protein